ncbi:MAG: hypothetical protein HRT58_00390 [Crocinitomicaceae bacterium]|nr:hypothetical protein [Crocinitomicaceae bacterium]
MLRAISEREAKSPKSGDLTGRIEENRLIWHLENTLEKVKCLSTLNNEVFFHYPSFGKLKRRDSIHFLELHTEHHLKIIRGIGSWG